MKLDVKAYSKASLISSIIFLIIGAILLFNANRVIIWISYIIGTSLTIIGLIKLIKYDRNKKLDIDKKTDLLIGLIGIILGIACFFLGSIFEVLIRLVIGAWILFSGIIRLKDCLGRKQKNTKNYIQLTVASTIIIIGLFLIFFSSLVLKWAGLAMVFYSILEIVGFMTYEEIIIPSTKIINIQEKNDKLK